MLKVLHYIYKLDKLFLSAISEVGCAVPKKIVLGKERTHKLRFMTVCDTRDQV